VMQVHTDFVTYFEITLWFFGRHAKNVRLTEIIRNSAVNCC